MEITGIGRGIARWSLSLPASGELFSSVGERSAGEMTISSSIFACAPTDVLFAREAIAVRNE